MVDRQFSLKWLFIFTALEAISVLLAVGGNVIGAFLVFGLTGAGVGFLIGGRNAMGPGAAIGLTVCLPGLLLLIFLFP